MNKIVHISKYKRFGPRGVHTGGVGKFAWYLRQAIPELIIYAWEDYPQWQEHDLGIQEWDQAPLLNSWLLESGLVGRETIAIVDGWWGMGLEGKVSRLISVCHGSYAGAMVEHLKNPWSNGFLLGQNVRHQEKFWKDSGCEIVAVSKNAVRELKLLCGLDSIVIENGIDLSIFGKYAKLDVPHHPEKPLILEVTDGMPAKGSDIIEGLKEMGYRIEPFGVKTGNLDDEAARWIDAEVALFPSRYEGGPYAWLEAMVCGCRVVVYWTGFAPDIEGLWVTDDHHPIAFAHLLDLAMVPDYELMPLPPQYSFNAFAENWRNFLQCES